MSPRRPAPTRVPAVSGIEVLYPAEDNRPVIVGERTNVIGSRRFKELIVEGKFEEAAEVGRAQVRSGGQVLEAVLADLEAFTDGAMQADDRTVLVVRAST